MDSWPHLHRLQSAIATLQWLADKAADQPADQASTTDMHLHLTLAALYLNEYTSHLIEGKSAQDALLAAARGERARGHGKPPDNSSG